MDHKEEEEKQAEIYREATADLYEHCGKCKMTDLDVIMAQQALANVGVDYPTIEDIELKQ